VFADIPMALLMWTWSEPNAINGMMRLEQPDQPRWPVLERKFPNCPLTDDLKLWVCEIEQKIWLLHQSDDGVWWLSSLRGRAPVTRPPFNIGLTPFSSGQQQGYQYWLFVEPIGKLAMQRQLEFRLGQLERQRLSVNDTHELIHLPSLNSFLSIYNYNQWTVLIWLSNQQGKR